MCIIIHVLWTSFSRIMYVKGINMTFPPKIQTQMLNHFQVNKFHILLCFITLQFVSIYPRYWCSFVTGCVTWWVVGMMCDMAQMKILASSCKMNECTSNCNSSLAATQMRWEFRVLAHSCQGIPKTLLIMFPPYFQNVTVLAFLPYINHLSASQRRVDFTWVCAQVRTCECVHVCNCGDQGCCSSMTGAFKIFTCLLNLSCWQSLSVNLVRTVLCSEKISLCFWNTVISLSSINKDGCKQCSPSRQSGWPLI